MIFFAILLSEFLSRASRSQYRIALRVEMGRKKRRMLARKEMKMPDELGGVQNVRLELTMA